jgi:hypothetical protein
MPGVARAVVVWAVLAGLFLMHGAAASAGGCQGSALLTAMRVTAIMPVTGSADGVPGTGHPVALPASAGMTGAPAGHVQVPASVASPAVAIPADCNCSGMHCVARQPRDVAFGSCGIPTAGAVLFVVGSTRSCLAPVAWLACRPPGRPGMPLPLFLGVSRT